jgi:hypothetical protein
MNGMKSQLEWIDRRAELLAELFLQELEPEFLARPTADFGYDFFAGFRNPRGGINIIAVEVKSTQKVTSNLIEVAKTKYVQWANSNLPVLLLVVDVKQSEYYFAWPNPDAPDQHQRSDRIHVSLVRIDDKSKGELRNRLAA